jgi:DNA-binding CsgD family transcriptional regulator
MGKSGRVRFADLRSAYRLIHECRDLGHDPAAWPRHAIEQLTRLVGAQVGLVIQFRLAGPGEPPGVSVLHDHGWLTPRHRAYWYEHNILRREVVRAPTFQEFVALSGTLLTRRREQLVGDAAWYSSAEFQGMNRQVELDDLLASGFRRPVSPYLFGLVLYRSLGEERHGERERRLVHLFHHELSRHLGTALALERGGAVAALSPRLRQTLDCLLEGDSEKQVAARLGLSRHKVHEYVTTLYRRLGVASRAELMARCLRRRPSGGQSNR